MKFVAGTIQNQPCELRFDRQFTAKGQPAPAHIDGFPIDIGIGENTLLPRQRGTPAVRIGVQSRWRGSECVLTEIRLKKGEPVDRALRRLKKRIDREGTLKIVRNLRRFEKPSERRRRKEKAARFSAMLSARYADL